MKTAAKARLLARRRHVLTSRRNALDCAGGAVGRARWHEVEVMVAEVGDPLAMEQAGMVGVLMAQLVERLAELHMDAAEVTG